MYTYSVWYTVAGHVRCADCELERYYEITTDRLPDVEHYRSGRIPLDKLCHEAVEAWAGEAPELYGWRWLELTDAGRRTPDGGFIGALPGMRTE